MTGEDWQHVIYVHWNFFDPNQQQFLAADCNLIMKELLTQTNDSTITTGIEIDRLSFLFALWFLL
jgi:hypothetical protein